MSSPDPYKILQVDPTADHDVIRAAYRRLAREYHPDVTTGPDAQQRMVQINQAWEMLRDPVRRAAVDRAQARAADSAARVAAANAHRHVRSQPGTTDYPGQSRATGGERGSGVTGAATPGRRPTPPFQGGHGAGGQSSHHSNPVSPDWSAGRSAAGGGYDPRTMGTAQGAGSAGPPPGNPSGSLLNFGRYSGWTLGEIARTDLEYLEWLERMPVGRTYQFEIDGLLRSHGRRATAPVQPQRRGLFRRR